METIPKEIEIGGKKYDLTKDDMPVQATFVSTDIKPEITLIPYKTFYNQETQRHERVPNTAVKVQFKGSHFHTGNKKLCQMLMECPRFQSGKIGPDPEDPTGFWRQLGVVQPVKREVIEDTSVQRVGFGDIDLKKLKVEKDEDGKPIPVEPLRKVSA